MRRAIVLACVLAQLAVLGWLVYGRENLIRTGRHIVVRTAPIDPRDPFRGDFVRLHYDVSRGDSSEIVDLDSAASIRKGVTVYASLVAGPGDVYEFSHYSLARPATPPFLRGTIQRHWTVAGERIAFDASFNIERLYVEQGLGVALETRRGERNGLQTAMYVELAVDDRGETALVGHDWAPLAIGIDVVQRQTPVEAISTTDRLPSPDQPPRPTAVLDVFATIENVSDADIAIVDTIDQCHFMLLPRRGNGNLPGTRFQPADPTCRDILPGDIIDLAPGEQHRIAIDPDAPRWQMTQTDTTAATVSGSLRDIAPTTMFRLVYTPPEPALLSHTPPIWQGRVLSQSFNFQGAFD